MTRVQRHNMSGRVLPPALLPTAIDTIAPAIYIIFLTIFLLGWKEKGRLSVNGLIFITSTTMFWQEFYADWGAYLHWNPDLALMPWGSTLWTTPNKPWYVIFTYGLFYLGILSGNYTLFKSTQKRKPEWSYWYTMFVTVMVPFFFYNMLSADVLGFWTYHFHYLYIIGPGLDTATHGSMPLFYPGFPFCTFGPFCIWSLDNRDDKGRTWFERWFGAEANPKDLNGQLQQLLAWTLGLNIMYAISLTIPLVVIRIYFLPESTVVP
jgi:hypothetical protein